MPRASCRCWWSPLLLVPLQSAAEELFFRGYLMQGFGWLAAAAAGRRCWCRRSCSPRCTSATPSSRGSAAGFLFYYAGIGVVLGLATLLDDGLEVAIGAHAANNLWGALVVSFPGSVLDTPALLRMEGVPPEVMVALGGATALTALVVLGDPARLGRWRAWEEWRSGGGARLTERGAAG